MNKEKVTLTPCKWVGLSEFEAVPSCGQIVITFPNKATVENVLKSKICPRCGNVIEIIKRASPVRTG